ncbi:MAG: addiction module protein [Byssovorax sp.]
MSRTSTPPILDALAHIPVGEEDLTPEELAELDRRAAELRSGRVSGVPHAEVSRRLEGLRREAG